MLVVKNERAWVKVKSRACWRYEIEREGPIRTQRGFVSR
jgi:hypothetical protein